jgi:hypothetical protein
VEDRETCKIRPEKKKHGGLAQLARAPALQAGGHRFDSDILHQRKKKEKREVRKKKKRNCELEE